MTSDALQYYIHDEPGALRLKLSGILAGRDAQDVYHAWRTALSILGGRPLIVDITFLSGADEPGRALLALWRRFGASIVAASASSRALARSVLGEGFPEPPARPGLLRRLRSVVPGRLRRPQIAGDSTSACRHNFRIPGGSSNIQNTKE
jgi:hypothetical protein